MKLLKFEIKLVDLKKEILSDRDCKLKKSFYKINKIEHGKVMAQSGTGNK